MAQLTVGVTLEYGESADGTAAPSSWSKVADVTSIPTLVGDPSTHDVTTLADTQKVYIAGLPDNGGVLGFGVLLTPEVATTVKNIQTKQETKTVMFRVGAPAPFGKCWQFAGEVTALANDEITPDNPLTGKINIVPSTPVELKDYSPGA